MSIQERLEASMKHANHEKIERDFLKLYNRVGTNLIDLFEYILK